MFLVNSRDLLVTATCSSTLRLKAKSDLRDRHPFYQRYGANLPNSLARSCPRRLRLLTQGTSVRSGYGHRPLLNPINSFFNDPGTQMNQLRPAIPTFTGVSPLRYSPSFSS